ncbi:maleate cis-trans isomerase family protein [Paraburkholderia rhynchosiae]|uniref:Maleate isomerase n=1 Tax=Paraburkholderia rhynchosiae TaxID=487049 RepID=A0A2N7WBP9_9BURK|nr:aspartate/glutamate racemase family protein [Paraburkholderia rhynchosiae]PMS26814.1 Asp/Glu racemase [Paraburkholderia rhynchosiae]CAB3728134.1 Maleate isomerase [Paraburkholderia rhynchosiae]
MISNKTFRIGQIVPSSNVTMEKEIPAMLRLRETVEPERFTFHSSRMRMKQVTKEELEAMDRDSDRCAAELADARIDVLGYACLVAIMSMGVGYHRVSEKRLSSVVKNNDCAAPVVTSAGALVDGLRALGVKRIALIAPYMKPLTQLVVDYLEQENIQVVSHVALEIPDNLEVGARDPNALRSIYRQLDLSRAEAVVLSACVQMPSLEAIQAVQDECGKPVVSAAVCTAFSILKKLGLRTYVPNAGELLSGRY